MHIGKDCIGSNPVLATFLCSVHGVVSSSILDVGEIILLRTLTASGDAIRLKIGGSSPPAEHLYIYILK